MAKWGRNLRVIVKSNLSLAKPLKGSSKLSSIVSIVASPKTLQNGKDDTIL